MRQGYMDRGGGDDEARSDRAREEEVAAAPRGVVLVVDDDEATRSALEKLLREDGFATSTAADGGAALAEARRRLPDVVITDLRVPRLHGVELCERLHELDAELPVIVMTGHSNMDVVMGCLRAGAEDYLIKPLQHDAVLWCVERALSRRAEKIRRDALHRELTERLLLDGIREHEHAEREAAQRAQLNMLLEKLSEGVAVCDPSGIILMLNDAGRRIFGLEGQDPSTVPSAALEAFDLQGHPLTDEQQVLTRAARGEQFADYEVQYVLGDGTRRRVVFAGTSVKDEAGNVALAILVFRDVTKVRRLEQQREEYLALISHDLRDPLNTIMLSVSMLKDSMERKRSTRDVNLAARAERNINRMTRMLEELTEATSLELHGVTLELARCDLRQLVVGGVDSVGPARARRIRIDADDASSHLVLADASRLERVIANLLTNALKYSAEDAPVTARLSRSESTVTLEVIDRGIGVAPESIEMLFDRYYRTAGGKTRASGLGLGLYIARLVLEAHGGRIDVTSKVGEGSTFRLTLPSAQDARVGGPPSSDGAAWNRGQLVKDVVARVRKVLARTAPELAFVPRRAVSTRSRG
jgi:PAS domain S-box-containing protein